MRAPPLIRSSPRGLHLHFSHPSAGPPIRRPAFQRRRPSVKRLIPGLVAIAVLPSAGPVLGQATSSQQTDRLIAQLESRVAPPDDKLARTPVPQAKSDAAVVLQRQQIRDERQRIQEIIEKIRSGQRIAPADIDRVLGSEKR